MGTASCLRVLVAPQNKINPLTAYVQARGLFRRSWQVQGSNLGRLSRRFYHSDGLDLMARWAPIAQAGALTMFAKDLLRSPISQDDVPIDGFVESVTRRVARTVS